MIVAEAASESADRSKCDACGGAKNAPIACFVHVGERIAIALCQVCGRDAANAIGFMCVKDGSWSKLEPRKRTSGGR